MEPYDPMTLSEQFSIENSMWSHKPVLKLKNPPVPCELLKITGGQKQVASWRKGTASAA
jgi:hypothetical protein